MKWHLVIFSQNIFLLIGSAVSCMFLFKEALRCNGLLASEILISFSLRSKPRHPNFVALFFPEDYMWHLGDPIPFDGFLVHHGWILFDAKSQGLEFEVAGFEVTKPYAAYFLVAVVWRIRHCDNQVKRELKKAAGTFPAVCVSSSYPHYGNEYVISGVSPRLSFKINLLVGEYNK